MRLMAAEESENHEGINPTRISHFQNVKKNTITSLLRGLEERGRWSARMTPWTGARCASESPAGRQLIESTTPDRLEFFNHLSSSLTDGGDALLALLEKLRISVFT